MLNEKKLVEDRNAKISAMDEIVKTAEAENRLPSDEEKAKFNNLKKEIADIDDALEMQKETQNMNQMIQAPATPVVDEAAEKAKIAAKERKQFENTLRSIRNEDTNTTVADGQVTIPATIWDDIIEKVTNICPIFEWADKYNEKGSFTIPKDGDGNLEVAYADEFSELEAKNVSIDGVTLNGYLAGALVKVSRTLINNSKFDIVDYVVNKVANKIAEFIEKEAIHGTAGKIKGLSELPADRITESAAATAITADELIDLQDSVNDKFQDKCYWIMSPKTRNAVRKLKDGQGNYLLQRDFTARWGYKLLERDVYVTDQMDDIAAAKLVVYYGDFSGLAINTHEGANIEILRERFATQHATGVVAWIENDIRVADEQKIAALSTLGYKATLANAGD